MLAVVGDLLEDVVVWPRGPVRAGTDNAATVYRRRGGSAANVAAFAAPRTPTRFVGRVGADALGDALVDALAAEGVDVRVQRGGRTGSVVLLVRDDGERTMFPDRAAAAELADVPTGWLDDVRVLHVPGYAFATGPGARSASALAHAMRERGDTVTMDASSTALLAGYGPGRFLGLVEEIRPAVLFANAAEAGLLGLDGATPPDGTLFVVKDGARPTTITDPAGGRRTVSVPSVARPRDTTGAGDAFAAGYLAAMLAGADPGAATVAGHELAAGVLDAPGAARSTGEDT